MNVKNLHKIFDITKLAAGTNNFFSAEIFVLPGLIRAVFVLACGPTTRPMGPRHQSLNVKKLVAGAEKISGMLVFRGEAPGRNFRGTGTQGREGVRVPEHHENPGCSGGREGPGAEYRRLCSNRFRDRTLSIN